MHWMEVEMHSDWLSLPFLGVLYTERGQTQLYHAHAHIYEQRGVVILCGCEIVSELRAISPVCVFTWLAFTE